jgi:hypothetical protein
MLTETVAVFMLQVAVNREWPQMPIACPNFHRRIRASSIYSRFLRSLDVAFLDAV